MRQPSIATLTAAVALVFANAQAATITTTSSPTITRAPSTTVDVRAQQTNAATAVTHASGSTSANAALLTLSDAQRNTPSSSLAPGVTSPGVVLRNGALVGDASDNTSGVSTSDNTAIAANSIYAAGDMVGGASVLDTSVTANPATQGNAASFDRAVREVKKERRRIGRNGQLLNTIAPRTNGVDRSREMPDDPLPAALTGTNSTLVR